MRHRIEYNDTYGAYMCLDCGTAFSQDALIAEMDGNGCPGPKADEGYTVSKYDTGAGLDSSRLVDADGVYSFTWSRTDMPNIPPSIHITSYEMRYEDETEARGRALIEQWEKERGE